MLYNAIPLLLLVVTPALADYDCICNYNEDYNVLSMPDPAASLVGHLYEFDCKPSANLTTPAGYAAIQFEKQIGYVQKNDQIQEQVCSGQPSPDDLFPTTTQPLVTTTTTTPRPTTKMSSMVPVTTGPVITTKKDNFYTTTGRTYRTTTRRITPKSTTRKYTTTIETRTPSTTPTMRTTTPFITTKRVVTTTQQVVTTTPYRTTKQVVTSSIAPNTDIMTTRTIDTSTSTIIKDHIEACPDHVRTDVKIKGGFLGQYGEFCFEVVDWLRPFDAAESHCRITSGHLVAITNQAEQDYISGLMTRHQFVNSSWIGLSDRNGEGTYSWNSGVPFSYSNFKGDFNQHSDKEHKLHDCFVLKQGGEWTDVPCGLSISFLGFGESHPFICQYNISAKLQSLFDILKPVIVG